MPVWTIAEVADEPAVTLTDLQVRELPTGDRHLVGFALESRKGRVSSTIEVFDPASVRAVTRSGQTYRLYGPSGIDCYGEYVWRSWSRLYDVTQFADVTATVLALLSFFELSRRRECRSPTFEELL
jgi:hypothetical protein